MENERNEATNAVRIHRLVDQHGEGEKIPLREPSRRTPVCGGSEARR